MPGADFSYADALAWLDAHINREAIAGKIEGLELETIRGLVGAMGDPQRAYPVVHITGTNGKGSVAHLTSALLEAHGLRVGLFTSPHLERVNERIAVDRRPLGEEEFALALDDVRMATHVVGPSPSYFEILTAAALGWFAHAPVDVAVVEVGLLGRFDATNVVDADVAIVTNIAKDHTDGVGDWAAAVASEKAGIIKPGSLAVIGPVEDRLWEIFLGETARGHWRFGRDFDLVADTTAVGGRLVSIDGRYGRYDDLFLSLRGAHQAANATLAIGAVEGFFGRALDPRVVASSFDDITVPGRFEIVGRLPLVVLDGAHNEAGAACLRTTLDEVGVSGRRFFVFGLLEPRDPVGYLRALGLGPDDTVYACAPQSPRAIDPAALATAAELLGTRASTAPSVAAALEWARTAAAPDDLVLATGSVLVAGEARAACGQASSFGCFSVRPAQGGTGSGRQPFGE